MGISKTKQWKERITSRELADSLECSRTWLTYSESIDVGGWDIWQEWIIVDYQSSYFLANYLRPVLDMVLNGVGEI